MVLIQILVLGIVRFTEEGAMCSEEGHAMEAEGLFLRNMFIA